MVSQVFLEDMKSYEQNPLVFTFNEWQQSVVHHQLMPVKTVSPILWVHLFLLGLWIIIYMVTM